MLNKEINKNFEAAAEIAKTIGVQLRRRASSEADAPFFGANFGGEPMVIWEQKDQSIVIKADPAIYADGRIDFTNNNIWFFKRV